MVDYLVSTINIGESRYTCRVAIADSASYLCSCFVIVEILRRTSAATDVISSSLTPFPQYKALLFLSGAGCFARIPLIFFILSF